MDRIRPRDRTRSRSVATVVWLAALAVGCGGGGGDPTGGMIPTDGPSAALADIQARVFTPRCATSQCHVGAGAPFGLDLGDATRSRANLVNVASAEVAQYLRVEPGNAADSYLFMKLISDPRIEGDPMPAFGAALGADDLQRIRDWIEDGAP